MATTTRIRKFLKEADQSNVSIRFYLPDERSKFARAVSASYNGMNVSPEHLPPELIARLVRRGDATLHAGTGTASMRVSVTPHVGWSVTFGSRTEGIPGLHGHISTSYVESDSPRHLPSMDDEARDWHEEKLAKEHQRRIEASLENRRD